MTNGNQKLSEPGTKLKHLKLNSFGLGVFTLLNIQLRGGPDYREALTTPGKEESLIIHWGLRRVSICWPSAAIRQLLNESARLFVLRNAVF